MITSKAYPIKKEEIGKKRVLQVGEDGKRGTVIIGKWTYYGQSTFSGFHRSDLLVIGNHCSIADNVRFFLCQGNHHPERVALAALDLFFFDFVEQPHKKVTVIGNDVWIGANVTIMPGIKIGNGAVIAAGSVVTKDVDDFTIVGGNPAKPIRKRFSDEIIYQISNVNWWNWSDEKIGEHRELFSLQDEAQIADYIKKNELIKDKGVPLTYVSEIKDFFNVNLTTEEIVEKAHEFLKIDDTAHRLYTLKTQSFENICVWIAALTEKQPKSIVEFGTQTGCSSSMIARLCRFLGIKTKIVTINIADELIYKDDDVEYIIEDFTDHVEDIWTRWDPDIVFQDAHMYKLIEDQIKFSEKNHRQTLHLFHDVGFKLFQHPMSIEKHEVPTSATGSWERHVLALYDEKLLNFSTRDFENDNLHIHIFDACADSFEFGIGVLRFK